MTIALELQWTVPQKSSRGNIFLQNAIDNDFYHFSLGKTHYKDGACHGYINNHRKFPKNSLKSVKDFIIEENSLSGFLHYRIKEKS